MSLFWLLSYRMFSDSVDCIMDFEKCIRKQSSIDCAYERQDTSKFKIISIKEIIIIEKLSYVLDLTLNSQK